MMSNSLVSQTLNGEEVFYLQGGTQYLPTIYIQKNKHWEKWMVFEGKTHEAITNRTFKTKEDCIDFINTYDKQTVSTLGSLYATIADKDLRQLLDQVDFINPTQVGTIPTGSDLESKINQQIQAIQQTPHYAVKDVRLIVTFFDGYVSLYTNCTNNSDERYFYLYSEDTVSRYKSWKTISVVKAMLNRLNICQQRQQKSLTSADIKKLTPSHIAHTQTMEQFRLDTFNGSKIYRLDEGTKYLPSIYIQYNTHWNKWMIFEAKTHQIITNRTFVSQQSCIDFINSYDEQSEETLNMLCSEIRDSELRAIINKIDFSEPKQIIELTAKTEAVKRIVNAQQEAIAETYQIAKDKIEPVCCFFDGAIGLYTNSAQNKDERMFYLFDNGVANFYTPWKTVSLAIALFKKLVDCDNARHKSTYLKNLVNKSLIDNQGNGFYFAEHITDSHFMYVQKVQVKPANGTKVAVAELPLTPLFLAKIKIEEGLLTLDVHGHFMNTDDEQESYFFEVIGG